MDQFNFNDFPNSNFNETNLDWLLSLVQQLTELVESGRYGVPPGGSTGQVLGKLGPDDFNTGWIDQTGGGGGTSNYAQLTNKPQINGVELLGNKTAAQLNITAAALGAYVKPNSGIPASDIAAGVIPTVPTNVSSFNNDAGYLTLATLPTYNGGVT